ncbi:fimbrillin family protein [Parabacteroides sp. OttesenSCG-928-G07]|nr:fimbrillin family protein [Parabacteroides sp. OttesenSCG-928-G07]
MKHTPYYITAIFALLIGWTGCSEEPAAPIIEGQKSMPLEISTNIKKQTRSTLAGNAFVVGDQFTLYHGSEADIIGNAPLFSAYENKKDGWHGMPGIFWDDLDLNVWHSFTGIMTNGEEKVALGSSSTFEVQTDQSDSAKYMNGDLLIAYGVAKYTNGDFRKLKLSFNHVFAHLKISIADMSIIEEGDKAPMILDENTIVKIENVKTEAELGFNVQTSVNEKGSTSVNPTGSTATLTTLRTQLGTEDNKQVFYYEAILPAQDMSDMVITFTNNTNQKSYSYALEYAKIEETGVTTANLLMQGQSTTLNLNIQKTEMVISATIKPWVERSASAEATPDDYPVFEIGGDDGGDDGGLIDDNDDYAGKTIRLTSDVDAKVLGLPIGTQEKPFRGTFDGQGYTIYNVDIEGDAAFLGVFGYTDGATIRDLNVKGKGVTNTNGSATSATGGLVGYANNTYIDNCHVLEYTTGVSAAYDNAGGLVGYVNGISYIKKSSAHTKVTATHNYGGGLIGRSENGMNLSYSFATGNTKIKGDYVGGLIGHTTGGVIEFCYAWGNAEGARFAGGLIGRAVGAENAKIANSYSAGTLVSGTTKGGLIGAAATSEKLTVTNCYWNVNLASGLGCSNLSLNSTNVSFSLVTSADAMTIMLNGICVGKDEKAEWELALREDNFQLPILKANNGKATPIQP